MNLVFKEDAFDFDADGFYATLLDFNRREIMKISYNNSLILTLFKGIEAAEDSYERKVLAFFEDYSKDGIFNAEIFANKLQLMREQAKSDGDTSALNLIRDRLRELMKTADKSLLENTSGVVDGRLPSL